MTANINEAILKIKQVGRGNTRIVPMTGESTLDGKQQIEICESGNWRPVVAGVTRKMAEDIIGQASNKVILG
jgi:hypothetical protein